MTKVNTVPGPMDTSEMGFTPTHEHIVNFGWCMVKAFPDFYDFQQTADWFPRPV